MPSFRDVIDREIPERIETWLKQNIGFRGTFVKTDNQINFSLFNEFSRSHPRKIILGKDKQLFEEPYIDAFNRISVLSEDEIGKKGRALKLLQERLAAGTSVPAAPHAEQDHDTAGIHPGKTDPPREPLPQKTITRSLSPAETIRRQFPGRQGAVPGAENGAPCRPVSVERHPLEPVRRLPLRAGSSSGWRTAREAAGAHVVRKAGDKQRADRAGQGHCPPRQHPVHPVALHRVPLPGNAPGRARGSVSARHPPGGIQLLLEHHRVP